MAANLETRGYPSDASSLSPGMPTGRPARLFSPGLSELSPAVQQALARQVVDPRGDAFATVYRHVTSRLAEIAGTATEVIPVGGNGSNGMEMVVVNLLSPGDHALVVVQGVFGDRFAEICTAYGIVPERLDVDWERPVDPAAIADVVARSPTVRAVLFAAVESSCGVANDVAAIAAAVRSVRADVLVIVDAVPSLGAHPFLFDAWEVDAVVGAANKALAGPTGLAFVALSARAWAAAATTTTPRYGLDLPALRPLHHQGQMRFTPPINLLFGLDAALTEIGGEGLPAWMDRHAEAAAVARRGLVANGLAPVVEDAHAARTVTVVQLPASVDAGALVTRMRDEHQVTIGQGRGHWADHAIRIGHLGTVSPRQVMTTISALAMAVHAEQSR